MSDGVIPSLSRYVSKGRCSKISVCACRGSVFVVCMCRPAHIEDMIQGSVSEGLGMRQSRIYNVL